VEGRIPDDVESGKLRLDQKGHEKWRKESLSQCGIRGEGKIVLFSNSFEIGGKLSCYLSYRSF